MSILGIFASQSRPKPVVTGGTLTSDATYYYRTFAANGTLGITVGSLVCDYLVVAGGGGGGYQQGGGGGAGGYRTGSGTLGIANYNITIGGGGTASSGGAGGNGINSSLDTVLVSTGGGGGGGRSPNSAGNGGSGGGSG